MTSHGDGVNPLRPYYIRPSIGERAEPAAPGPNAFSSASARNATTSSAAVATTPSRYASKARDMFGDVDYKGFMDEDAPSMARSAKELLDDLVWKYTSVLMAQPFEVAKTILQARNQDENALASASEENVFARSFSSQGLGIYEVYSSTSMVTPDTASFFLPLHVLTRSTSTTPTRKATNLHSLHTMAPTRPQAQCEAAA